MAPRIGGCSPLGLYLVIQRDALCRDPLKGYPSGRQCVVDRGFVPPLHTVPSFLVEVGVYLQGCLYLPSRINYPPLPVCLQDCVDRAVKEMYEGLVLCRVPYRGDSCAGEPPCGLQDTVILPCFPRPQIQDRPP